MSNIQINVKLPEDLYLALKSAGIDRNELSRRALRDVAVQLYAERRLTLGKAARLAGLSLAGFWWLLVDRGIPVIEYTEEDYEEDMKAIKELTE